MSEVENALAGADVAPVADEKPIESQETPQESTPAETDEQKEERARNEKGQFVQKRINELTRAKHEAQRQAEFYQRERDEARAEAARYRQPAAPDPNVDLDGYIRHIAEGRASELVEQERAQWQNQQQQHHYQSIAQQYESREQDYAAKHPEYADAVDAFTSIAGVNPQLAEVLMTSDHGPAVVHFLGQHLDEAARIVQMPPHLAAAAVARLEAKVSSPKPKPVTNAPTPTPSLDGGSAIKANPEKMSIKEWMAWRNSQ